MGIGDVIWTRKTGSQPGCLFFAFGDHLNFDGITVSISPKSFFFLVYLNLERKTVSILLDTFFFWRSPMFGHENRLNLINDRSKSGSRSFGVVFSLQNSPPLMQIPRYAPVRDQLFEDRSTRSQEQEWTRPRTWASRPRPSTLKCVIKAKDVFEDSTFGNDQLICKIVDLWSQIFLKNKYLQPVQKYF